MNRSIAMLILSVVLLAMILLVINQWSASSLQQEEKNPQADFSAILDKQAGMKPVPVPDNAPTVRKSMVDDDKPVPFSGTVSPEGSKEVAAIPATVPQEEKTLPDLEEKKEIPAPVAVPKAALEADAEKQMKVATQKPAPKAVSLPAEQGGAAVNAQQAPMATSTLVSITPAGDAETAKSQPAAKSAEPVKQAAQAATEKTGFVMPEGGMNVVKDMAFVYTAGKGVLSVNAMKPFTYKVFMLKAPARMVVDLNGAFDALKNPVVSKNPLISAVRVGRHKDKVRIVLDVAGGASIHWDATQKSANMLDVTIKR